jgi:hypothetical protein
VPSTLPSHVTLINNDNGSDKSTPTIRVGLFNTMRSAAVSHGTSMNSPVYISRELSCRRIDPNSYAQHAEHENQEVFHNSSVIISDTSSRVVARESTCAYEFPPPLRRCNDESTYRSWVSKIGSNFRHEPPNSPNQRGRACRAATGTSRL